MGIDARENTAFASYLQIAMYLAYGNRMKEVVVRQK
jgi:hypothetical protein